MLRTIILAVVAVQSMQALHQFGTDRKPSGLPTSGRGRTDRERDRLDWGEIVRDHAARAGSSRSDDESSRRVEDDESDGARGDSEGREGDGGDREDDGGDREDDDGEGDDEDGGGAGGGEEADDKNGGGDEGGRGDGEADRRARPSGRLNFEAIADLAIQLWPAAPPATELVVYASCLNMFRFGGALTANGADRVESFSVCPESMAGKVARPLRTPARATARRQP